MNDYNQEKFERTFMQALLKHTGIALAILVPLAAYTSYAHANHTISQITISNQTVVNHKIADNMLTNDYCKN